MTDEQEYYVVGIDDLFKVSKDDVDNEEEAVQYVLDRLGQESFIAYNGTVLDEVEGDN